MTGHSWLKLASRVQNTTTFLRVCVCVCVCACVRACVCVFSLLSRAIPIRIYFTSQLPSLVTRQMMS